MKTIRRAGALVGVASALVLAAVLPASAAVHLQAESCPGVTYCYYNYDSKTIPGSSARPGTSGTFDLGALIRMSSSGGSYCPSTFMARNNLTTKAENIYTMKIIWTDTSGVQHVSTGQSWGSSGVGTWQSGETTEKTSNASWFNVWTGSCTLWIPRHQSDTLWRSGNGIWFYGGNSQQSWTERIDLY